MLRIRTAIFLGLGTVLPASLGTLHASVPQELQAEPAAKPDWLLDGTPYTASVVFDADRQEIRLDNGLIRRTLRLAPDAATVGFDNLMTGAALLRGVKPEAVVSLDGTQYPVGGLLGQTEYAYLLPEWLESMRRNQGAFHYLRHRSSPIEERFGWQRKRWSEDRPWPPPGQHVAIDFAAPAGLHAGIEVTVHYALYDGIPLLCKWITLVNGTARQVRLDTFTSELLAAVEYESDVEPRERWDYPNIHVETDYAMGGFSPRSAIQPAQWVPDPQYVSQVNYQRHTPNLLVARPPLGPALLLMPGERFESFRTWELVHDSSERERTGLAVRRMYRTIAPWVTENPILMHVRNAAPEAVKLAIDQCAEVGFEMVVLSFGSGFNIEDESGGNLRRWKELADYAHQRGVELGGYSLLSSRRLGAQHDVIDPATGAPGGAKFGSAPCLESAWGQNYFRKLYRFYEETGFDVLEHDGSYPGDVCASTGHPGHEGLADSQWRQRQRIVSFYRWCRENGVYLNVPDWYFLNGSSKIGMGYRETNWSLPREQQVILGRQNIHDGTWAKTPSMGWMFVPLVEYHGGGKQATLEPLAEHLDAYAAHLANNFGAGVQACYRGPRLYDTEATRAVVAQWVDFYKTHRAILDSDLIHLRRADGRDLDALLHVNPQLQTRGLLCVWNPSDEHLERQLSVPLYYTGLSDHALVSAGEAAESAAPVAYELDREYRIRLPVDVPPRSMRWFTITAP